jgi:Family of unknown function (DUF6174)
MRKIFFVFPTLLITLSSSILQPVNALTHNDVKTAHDSNGLNGIVISQSPSNGQLQKVANSNLKQLKINRRLWNQQKISNYRYTLGRDCFCAPEARGPVVIQVRNGKTISITNAANGKPVNPELFKEYNTIPKLFNSVKDAIDRKEPELTVQYNQKLGYPTQIKIGSLAADAGVVLTIENLQSSH